MKRAAIFTMCVGLFFFSACGGSSSGGGGAAASEAEAAFDDFAQAVEDCVGQVVANINASAEVDVGKDQTATCQCDNGGTITATASDDLMDITVVFDECISQANETYTGTLSSSNGGTTINGTMTEFGECSSGTATNLDTDGCSGSVAATCPSGSVACTVTDSSTEGECDLNC